MTSRKKQALLLTLLLALAAVVSGWAALAGAAEGLQRLFEKDFIIVDGPGPIPTLGPPINITRAEYEQALGRWRAQDIEEYEFTVERVGGEPSEVCDARATVRAKRIELRDIYSSSDWDKCESAQTVEEMFASIAKRLDDLEKGQVDSVTWVDLSGNEQTIPLDNRWHIEFDDILGYPYRIRIEYEGIMINNPLTRVIDLKILKNRQSTTP